MAHDDTQIDVVEDRTRTIFRQAEREVPASLDARIKAMAKRVLNEKQKPGHLLRGNFTSMAAADNASGDAVVLTDRQSGTELSVWTARGKQHAYFIEIKASDGDESAIASYIGHPYSILVDNEAVFDSVITDNHISESIELDESRATPPQWSFEIYAKKH